MGYEAEHSIVQSLTQLWIVFQDCPFFFFFFPISLFPPYYFTDTILYSQAFSCVLLPLTSIFTFLTSLLACVTITLGRFFFCAPISWFRFSSHSVDLLIYLSIYLFISRTGDQLELHICLLGEILNLDFLGTNLMLLLDTVCLDQQNQFNSSYDLLSVVFRVFKS